MAMEFLERAREAVKTGAAHLPASTAAPILEELNAGEEIAALIDLLEAAPELVEAQMVDELEQHLGDGSDVFARVGRSAIARYRDLTPA